MAQPVAKMSNEVANLRKRVHDQDIVIEELKMTKPVAKTSTEVTSLRQKVHDQEFVIEELK